MATKPQIIFFFLFNNQQGVCGSRWVLDCKNLIRMAADPKVELALKKQQARKLNKLAVK